MKKITEETLEKTKECLSDTQRSFRMRDIDRPTVGEFMEQYLDSISNKIQYEKSVCESEDDQSDLQDRNRMKKITQEALKEIVASMKDTLRHLRVKNVDRPTVIEFVTQFMECLEIKTLYETEND